VARATIPAALDPLRYVVKFSAPDDDPNLFALPRPGTVALTGGLESVAAAPAKATIMAND